MQNALLQVANKLNRSHKQKKWRQRMVNTLAMLVVFCTTYALILPAITMEAEPVCGLEVHEHTETCFAQKQVTSYICEQDARIVVHDHSDLCFDAEGTLICPLPEVKLHSHVEGCYAQDSVLVCALEEVSSHGHGEACTTTRNLVCELPEMEGHSHSEGCYAQQLVCETPEGEAHTHEDGCYTVRLVCQLSELEGHAHGESCYVTEDVACPLAEVQGHTHAAACYAEKNVVSCGQEEVLLHTHQADCYNEDDTQICGLPQVVVHIHSDSCLAITEKTIQICGLEAHEHTDACYPVEEGAEIDSEYFCGSGVHTHIETCYDEAGEKICTIPGHTHGAACLVKDYDPDADVETPEQWKQSVGDVTLTGIWSEDLLAVAKSQLGYTESTRNVVLDGDILKGYTRYGARFGDPYGDWDAMYVAFCLEYAEITQDHIPYGTNAAQWVLALEKAERYADSESYTPVPGDLVFVDTDLNGEADHVGILNEIKEDGSLKILTGDTEENMVGYATLKDGILGYGILPRNPLSKEAYDAANAAARQIAALPAAADVEAAFQSLNEQGDKAGHEALRQELITRMEAIIKAYEGFNDLQKARVGSLDSLEALKELCGGVTWQQHPSLTDDNAAVVGLSETGVTIVPDPGREAEEMELPENAIRNGDWAEYSFTVETVSYYTDITYGEAMVKVELVLPFAEEEAVFDISRITWLEDAQETTEYRTINGEQISCQILTGYKRLASDEENTVVVPGSFTETVPVQLKQLSHGSKLFVIISAAMEHGTWEGLCDTHQVEEKLTIATDPLTLYAPLSPEEQQAMYEMYLEKLAALAETQDAAAISELEGQITESYLSGQLDVEQYSDLNERVLALSGVDLNKVAEPSKGNGWAFMDFDASGYTVGEGMVFSTARRSTVPMMSAMPSALAESLALDSNSQIPEDGWGGENSQDDVIWVSKTIEGTDQENVFDITLQIITKEEVTEIYKEPNMAVVIVMDISNTMTSVFSGEETVTRYDAAMDSAYAFMQSFAEETDGLSKLGYVAFNTHGHEVFSLQECSTLEQANALNTVMRNETKAIMESAAKAAGGSYGSSHDRFTNIEAGLKMAEDMLADVPNEHKYVIFLSDGFPTTYMTASTTDGYKGYDPYTSSGTNGNNGVFYDRIMGHHCDYGTSYSDTAAIKAREQAVSMKNKGINIFSIGVDVEGQTIWEYHWDSTLRLKTASTVERRQTASYYNSTGYEIGTLHSEITKYETTLLTLSDGTRKIDYSKLPDSARSAMSQDFKNWLKGTAATGIGSDFYYDSTDQADLSDAYNQIFEKILEMNAESAHLDWVATDPMPDMGVHELETMEFIGFWDMYRADPVLTMSLSGESADNSLWNNTATFDTEASTIHWDLKESGYQKVEYGDNRNYMTALKYRVRLQNENTGFIEKQSYDTNDTTFLNYRIIEVVNNVTQISERKYIEFPIPKVFGYLAELNFLKTDPLGQPLSGAKFQLIHDTESCGTCRGDDVGYVNLPIYEAVSGDDGMVRFTNIPSGHHYTLTEAEAPENYIKTDNIYKVVVSYDALTVTVTDADGNPLEWTESIENDTYYSLPSTGGMGTSHFTFGGMLLILAAAAMMYMSKCGRKQRKGGAHER